MNKRFVLAGSILLLIGYVSFLGSDEIGNRTYQVQPGDCLWKIAIQFYGDGKLYEELFLVNRKLLDSVFIAEKIKDVFLNQDYHRAEDFLKPGVMIVLPDSISDENCQVWINLENKAGFTIAKDSIKTVKIDIVINKIPIKIADAIKVVGRPIEYVIEQFSKPEKLMALDSFPEPVKNFILLNSGEIITADRGEAPPWIINPVTNYQRYAREIADKYPQLQYVDCLIIANRIYDYFGDNEDCIIGRIPDNLPFDIDTTYIIREGRDEKQN